MIKRLLSMLFGTISTVVLTRWGFGFSTPSRDMRKLVRAVGWVERTLTRLDAFMTKCEVIVTDLIGLDRLRWRMLRRRYLSGEFNGDSA